MALFTADEIRSLYARACAAVAAWEEKAERDDIAIYDPENRYHADIRSAVDALRLCASVAAHLQDPSLVDLVADVCDYRDPEEHADNTISFEYATTSALAHVLRAGPPSDANLDALATNPVEAYRSAVARGLRPTTPKTIDVLRRLATDSSKEVRVAAIRALAPVGGVPWWSGKWAQDPLARLTSAEVPVHSATIETVSKLLDERYWVEDVCERLVAALRTLPFAIAVEPAEVACRGDMSEAATFLLEHDDGIEPFLRAMHARMDGGKDSAIYSAAHAIRDLPIARRRVVLAKLVERCCRSFVGAEIPSAPYHESELIEHAWPDGDDCTVLVDALLRIEVPRESTEWGLHGITTLLDRGKVTVTAKLGKRLLAAWRDGGGGAWARIPFEKLFQRAPRNVLRRAAEAAIRFDDDERKAWGWKMLLTKAHDPAKDPRPREMAQRLFADPATRALVVNHLAEEALPALRAALRRGDVDLREAAATVSAAKSLFLETRGALRHYRDERLAELGDLLGDESFRGGPTDDEMRQAREARLRTVGLAEDEELCQAAFGVLPPGPIVGDDLPFRDLVLGMARKSKHSSLWVFLLAHADAEIIAGAEAFDAREGGGRLDYFIKRAKKRIGLGLDDDEIDDVEDEDEDEESDDDETGDDDGKEWMDRDD